LGNPHIAVARMKSNIDAAFAQLRIIITQTLHGATNDVPAI
jgi:hypothetical protein